MECIFEFVSISIRVPFQVSHIHYARIMTSFILCQIIYLVVDWYSKRYSRSYSSLNKREQAEWQTRVASTFHSLTVWSISCYVILTDHEMANQPVFTKNPLSGIAFCISIGYFASDFLKIIRYRIPPVLPIICHHLFAGWGFLICVSTIGEAHWFGTFLLLTEATNPFNNTYWFLEKLGRKNTVFYQLIGYCFVFSWFIFRILVNPVVVWKAYLFWDHLMELSFYLKFLLALNIGFLMLMNNVYFITGPFYEIIFGLSKKEK